MSEEWEDTIIPPTRELEPWLKDHLDARVAEGADEIVLSREDFERVARAVPHRALPPRDPETLLFGPMVLEWRAVPVRWSRGVEPIGRGE